MSEINRRAILKALAAAPVAGGFHLTAAAAERAHEHATATRAAAQQGEPKGPQFFTEAEDQTVRILVDLIIPADERSGSATELGVPEFMDFIMIDMPWRQTPMRGGLALLDYECEKRHSKPFRDCDEKQRKAMLDEIAWPAKAKPELAHLVAFFNSFRDLTASGFWTTKAGMEDLQYLGNTFVDQWNGCPQEALDHVGVKYED